MCMKPTLFCLTAYDISLATAHGTESILIL